MCLLLLTKLGGFWWMGHLLHAVDLLVLKPQMIHFHAEQVGISQL